MAINLTNTANAAASINVLNAKAIKKTSKVELTEAQKAGRDKTIAGLEAKASEGVRVTYARLAELARANNWIGESNISDGQRGAGLMGQVPQNLQAFVCQSSGRYDKKAKEKFLADPENLMPVVDGHSPEQVYSILRFLPAEGPGGIMRTFEPKVNTGGKKKAAASDELGVSAL